MSDDTFKYPYKKDFYSVSTTDFTQAGVYPAKCVQVVFMGSHEKVVDNKRISLFCPVSFAWEIGRPKGDNIKSPWLIYHIYHYNTDPYSALMKMLQAWNGRAFTEEDIKEKKHSPFKYLNKYCRLVIGLRDISIGDAFNRRPFVQDILLPDATTDKLSYCAPTYFFSAASRERDMGLFKKLPPWMQKKVRNSLEWQQKDAEKAMDKFWDELHKTS